MPLRGRAHPGFGRPRYPGTFLLALREAAAGLNWQVCRWTSQLVECADDQGRRHIVTLDAFYRRVRPSPRDQWPALLAELLRAATERASETRLPTDLAADRDGTRTDEPGDN